MKRRPILLTVIGVSVFVVLVCIGILRYTKVDIAHAVRYWSLNRIRVLLWIRPDFVNSTDEYGNTPLHIAANGCSVDELALFLAKGANINARDNHGNTPLRDSIIANRQDEAGWLMAHGAEVNVKDDGGVTPLHLAVRQRFPDMVALLLANKADVNARDNNGETPLYWACKQMKDDMGKSKIHKDDWMVLSNALYEADSPTNKLKVTNWPYTGNGPPYYDGEPTIVEMLRLHGGEK
jgi:hypothetical protein